MSEHDAFYRIITVKEYEPPRHILLSNRVARIDTDGFCSVTLLCMLPALLLAKKVLYVGRGVAVVASEQRLIIHFSNVRWICRQEQPHSQHCE